MSRTYPLDLAIEQAGAKYKVLDPSRRLWMLNTWGRKEGESGEEGNLAEASLEHELASTRAVASRRRVLVN